MDNLAGMINEILKDPSSMEKVRSLAQSLGLDAAPAEPAGQAQLAAPPADETYTPVQPPAAVAPAAVASTPAAAPLIPPPAAANAGTSASAGLLSLLEGKNLAPMLELLSGGGGKNDPRVQLLHTLRPFLSPDKHAVLDRVIMALTVVGAGKLLFASVGNGGAKDGSV